MLISKYFTAAEVIFSETALARKINNSLPPELESVVANTASHLDYVQELLGKPLLIDSFYRCLELNTALGSKPTSQHCKGEAVDFICPSFGTPWEIANKILQSKLDFDQMIWEKTWIHISWNSNPNVKNRNQTLTLMHNGSYGIGLLESQ